MIGKILLGPACTGKSRSVRLITRDEKVYMINGRMLTSVKSGDIYYWFRNVLSHATPDITTILVDDVPASKLSILIDLLLPTELEVHPKFKSPFLISPNAIIISDAKFENVERLGASVLARFDIYTYIENRDHEIVMKLHHSKLLDKVYNKKS